MLTFWVWWIFLGASIVIVDMMSKPGVSTNDKAYDTAVLIGMAICWPIVLMWAIRRK